MMRPMILEFPQEMGVKDLDMQYMLGDSILVALIFREDSVGEFYLPGRNLDPSAFRRAPGRRKMVYQSL